MILIDIYNCQIVFYCNRVLEETSDEKGLSDDLLLLHGEQSFIVYVRIKWAD